ncbi:Histone deacetylase 6 [Phlyctochytrium planicorne]|nr:Histone deacetylase 6 [Phlyctochytrium planicorne]
MTPSSDALPALKRPRMETEDPSLIDDLMEGAQTAIQTILPARRSASPVRQTLPPTQSVPKHTGIVYDVRLLGHTRANHVSIHGDTYTEYPEVPERIRGIYLELRQQGLLDRCKMITAKPAIASSTYPDPLLLVHSLKHVEKLERSKSEGIDGLQRLAGDDDDIFFTPDTAICARLACGGVIEACRAVLGGEVTNAFAIVRGFCHANNVAIAVKQVVNENRARRVLIVDWDVHHGNGTQKAFYNSPNVLFFSVHRYENGKFYPYSRIAEADSVGSGEGKGKNVNVPWPCAGMGDSEYMYVWRKVLLPIAIEFEPDLVVVSAGFDAADGDPLGECNVTPNGFAHLTRRLMSLAGGKVVLALEGGYNIDVISRSAAACVSALLNDPLTQLHLKEPKEACVQTVDEVIGFIKPYWNGFGQASAFGSKDSDDFILGSSYPLSLATRWYTRSILLGLLNLEPFELPPARTPRRASAGGGDAIIRSTGGTADQVDSIEAFASRSLSSNRFPCFVMFLENVHMAFGDIHNGSAQVADGPAPYYHELVSRGHPIVTVDISMENLKKFSSLPLDDALSDCGDRVWGVVAKQSPSNIFIFIGAGRGADVVSHLINKYSDQDKRIAGAVQFTHEMRPKKITAIRGADIVHSFVSGINLDSTSVETVDQTSLSVAETMIKYVKQATQFMKKQISVANVDET